VGLVLAVLWDNEKSRFIVSGPFDEEMPFYYVIITDFKWWMDNELEIVDWMNRCLPRGALHVRGMVIELDNEEQTSLFLLRWQK
jgi:hypothetical protein